MISGSGVIQANYAGKYELREVFCHWYISSIEKRDVKNNENQVEKKAIYFSDESRTGKAMYLELAKVNLENEKSVLDFCDKYGLLCSSRIADEGKIESIADEMAEENSQSLEYIKTGVIKDPLCGYDYMALDDFLSVAVYIKKIVGLMNQLNLSEFNSNACSELIVSLLLSDKASRYLGDENIDSATKIIRNEMYSYGILRSPEDFHRVLLEMAHDKCQTVQFNGKVAEEYELLQKFLLRMQKKQWQPKTDDPYSKIALAKGETVDIDIRELQHIARIVLKDIINEGIRRASPEVTIDEIGRPRGQWKIEYLIDGIFIELYWAVTGDHVVRKCENPPCGNYFATFESRGNKKYCCRECADAAAHRKKRLRDRNKKSISMLNETI